MNISHLRPLSANNVLCINSVRFYWTFKDNFLLVHASINMFRDLHALAQEETETLLFMSREKWKATPYSEENPHHGEKFNQIYLRQTMIYQNMSLKQENSDMDIFQCVNPHEVNPMPQAEVEAAPIEGATGPLGVTSRLNWHDINCGGFYKPHLKRSPHVKLEMETFDDLSRYIPQLGTRAKMSPVDELNTPTFVIATWTIPNLTVLESCSSRFYPLLTNSIGKVNYWCFQEDYEMARPAFFTQTDYEPPEMEEFKFDANAINSTYSISNNDSTMFENMPSNSELVGNNNLLSYNIIMSPVYEDHTYFNKNIKNNNALTNIATTNLVDFNDKNRETPNYSNIDINDSTSGCSNNGYTSYSNASSPMEDTSVIYHNYETPENTSDSYASVDSTNNNKPNLKLDLPNNNITKVFSFTDLNTINTPDILETVQSLEDDTKNFNILDYISNKEILTLNADELLTPKTVSTPSNSNIVKPRTGKPLAVLKTVRADSVPKKQPRNQYIPEKRPRKRKTSYESDEEYLPPTKKISSTKLVYVSEEDRCSEDSNDSVLSTTITNNRRRKVTSNRSSRSSSISSEIKDCDAYKYRELRDKNNEASRKSRQKRKSKELELEKEADELDKKNIKLKAQVSELERMVNSFRQNLFALMMKK